MRRDAILAVDLGTGSVRACMVGLDGRVLAKGQRRLRSHAPSEAPSGREYDPDEVKDCVAQAVSEARSRAPDAAVAAVTACGIRPAFVMLDARGTAIHVGANLDLRGIEQSIALLSKHRALLHQTTGQLPPTLQWSSRIAWFSANQPDLIASAKTFTGLESWVLSLLGVEPAVDLSCASGTGLFDIRSGTWSGEILGLLRTHERTLAPVVAAGTVLGRASGDFAKALGLDGAAVCAGGGDTHAALAGAAGTEPGSTALVGGTTMAAVRVLGEPGPRAERLWSSLFLRPEAGMVEAQCWEAGLAWEWIADAIGGDVADLGRLAGTAAPCAAMVHLGTAPVDFADPALLRSGGFMFPLPPTMFGIDRASIARGALESAAWAAAEAVAWLDADAPGAGRLCVTGGMTRSALWLSMLAGALGRPVRIAQEDAAAVGIAAFAAAGAGLVGPPEEMLAEAHALGRDHPPDDEIVAVMQGGRERWLETVGRLERGAVRLSDLMGQ